MIYILLAIVLMFMDQRGHYVPRARSVLEQAFEPVFFLVCWPADALHALDEHTRAREDLITENEQLRQQIFEMSGSMQTLDALQRENQRLRTLLEATQGDQPPTVLEVQEIEWLGRPAFLFVESWSGAEASPSEALVVQGEDYWLYVLRIRATAGEAMPWLLQEMRETFVFVE